MKNLEEIKDIIRGIAKIENVVFPEEGDPPAVFNISLTADSRAAFRTLEEGFRPLEYEPVLTEGDESDEQIIVLPPQDAQELRPASPLWHALLLALTLLTTTYAGALKQGANLFESPERAAEGLPFAIALIVILGVHELAHYVVSRRLKVAASIPYFLPFPAWPGTIGAFVRIKSRVRERSAFFDIGIAGPAVGAALSAAALVAGLSSAKVALEAAPQSVRIDGSIALSLLWSAVHGSWPAVGTLVAMGPLAMAGWLGLMLTALNMMPVGHLDGGHVAYALLGRRYAQKAGMIAVGMMILLGLAGWAIWLMWALVSTLLIGLYHEPALDDLSDPGRARRILGGLAFALMALVVSPMPSGLLSK